MPAPVHTNASAAKLESILSHKLGPVTLTSDQARCVEVLQSMDALHNLVVPGGSLADAISLYTGGFSVLLTSELATYDSDALTRLVLAAHQHCVRVAISPWYPHLDPPRALAVRRNVIEMLELDTGDSDDLDLEISALVVRFHARDVESASLYDSHPTIEQVVR